MKPEMTFAVAPAAAQSESPLFLIGQDSRGNWVVQDQSGLRGGLFVSQAAARKFALFENGDRPELVIFVPGRVRARPWSIFRKSGYRFSGRKCDQLKDARAHSVNRDALWWRRPYCGSIPAARTTSCHFRRSPVMNSTNSAGVIGDGTAPTSNRVLRTSGCSKMRFTSAAS